VRHDITEHVARTQRHATFYLACGPENGPLVIFVHGWPELSVSWRHQLPCFGNLGFRAVAPDMRGYGRSSVYSRHEDYALEHCVTDMLELLEALGRSQAIWVGHDWGSPVVWSLASHKPEQCLGVANLCVPYLPRGFVPDGLIEFVDRGVYPQADYPAGQWEYMRFYEENFSSATRCFEANILLTVKALFRSGNPKARGKPARTALVRKDQGWFGGAGTAPDLPMDPAVLTDEDLHKYVSALTRNGFFGPDSWYMNARLNSAYASSSLNDGKLHLPVLFLHGAYDYTCETLSSRLAQPMRRECSDLTEMVVDSGHWMAQEQPSAVNAALTRWLVAKFPQLWPAPAAAATLSGSATAAP
jgi:pimeloyl-ACP methyl ester carboxylesterase